MLPSFINQRDLGYILQEESTYIRYMLQWRGLDTISVTQSSPA